jgi:tRNA(His) 5'-end guanylyltransferase
MGGLRQSSHGVFFIVGVLFISVPPWQQKQWALVRQSKARSQSNDEKSKQQSEEERKIVKNNKNGALLADDALINVLTIAGQRINRTWSKW